MQVPSNELASSLIGTLNITDIRYALEYYGYFLKDIPRRLGSSAALDAAVKALVTAYPYFHGRDFPPDALLQYGRSLRALRESLGDSNEARSANTLCAVYIITICQVFSTPTSSSMFCDMNTDFNTSIIHRAGLENMTINWLAMGKPLLIS